MNTLRNGQQLYFKWGKFPAGRGPTTFVEKEIRPHHFLVPRSYLQHRNTTMDVCTP